MIRVLCGALAAVLALSLPAFGGEESGRAPETPTERSVEHVEGRLVVGHQAGQTLPAAALTALGVIGRSRTSLPGVVTLDLPEPAVDVVMARLSRDPRVAWVERDVVVRAAEVQPNDTLWPQQWGLAKIGAPTAWERTTGSSSVTVAVLDTGVDASHPELLGRVRSGTSFVSGGLGTVDDNGHGTQSAGLVAAQGDNLVGIAGLCWSCGILPVKVLDANGFGNTTQLAEGIIWAVDNGADIINMSLGADQNPRALNEAVGYATSHGVVMVAAAGNGDPQTGQGVDQKFFPAADPRVISVGATNSNDRRYDFSNHTWVEVAAPGCNVTTTPLAGFTLSGCFLGTSSAAPLVSGTAALMLSHTPAASPADVRDALEATAVPVTGFVHGRIDAAAALETITSVASPEPTPTPTPSPTPTPTPTPTAEPVPEACPSDRVPSAGFTDTRGNTHERPIDCIVWYRIAQGVGANRYGPELVVSRAQMASFIARMLDAAGVPLSSAGGSFDDISGNPHEQNINKLANAGIVQGTAPRTYAPNARVRRDQMASFLVRAYELAGEELHANRNHFADTRGNQHEQNINKAAQAGLVRGTGPTTYAPTVQVRRDQMGSFIARTLELLVERGHMQPR